MVKNPDPQNRAPVNNLRRGLVIFLIAMVILPLMDATAKHLTSSISPGLIVWSRMLFQTLFLVPVLFFLILTPSKEWQLQTTTNISLHWFALRGFLIAAATLFFFSALVKLPIADALAIFFIEPMLLTILAALFLGESIGARRSFAVIIGFIGALIIIQPSIQVFGPRALLPLGAAFCFAWYMLLTGQLAAQTHPVLIQFLTGIFALISISLALAVGHQSGIEFLTISYPSASDWIFMLLLGLLACVGHLLVVIAFRYVAASVLAPFQYFEIVGAVAFGWYFFGDVPAPITWLGITIIVSAGVYLYARERYHQQQPNA